MVSFNAVWKKTKGKNHWVLFVGNIELCCICVDSNKSVNYRLCHLECRRWSGAIKRAEYPPVTLRSALIRLRQHVSEVLLGNEPHHLMPQSMCVQRNLNVLSCSCCTNCKLKRRRG